MQKESKIQISHQKFKELIQILQVSLPQHLLPCLYRKVDSFILTSKGEGWGRPYAEALSLQLPVSFLDGIILKY